MIRVFLLVLASMAGTWYLADSIKQKGPGYVYIYYNQYSVETSFWFFLFLVVGLVVGTFLITKIISLLLYYLVKIGYLPKFFWMNRAKKLRYQGNLAFLNQQWQMAGKKMARAAKNSETPFLDYLMAARANLAVNDIAAAVNNAGLAKKASDFEAGSHALLELDILIAQGDTINQPQSIKKLLDNHADKPAVLLRAIRIYRQQKQWQALQALLPLIKKHKVLSQPDYCDVLADITVGIMPTLTSASQRQDLKALWKSAAKVHDRDNVMQSYCTALARMNEGQEAQKLLEMHLHRHWSDLLMSTYASIPVADNVNALDFAESFLPMHPHNPALLTALGWLSKNNGYLAKAKDYLSRSMQIRPSVKACELLAEIADIQHDYTQAQNYLRQALKLAVNP
jgi:HemY protein